MNNVGSVRCSSVVAYQRLLRGWSQHDLVLEVCKLCHEEGEFPGLSEKTVRRWEQGRCIPSPFYRKRLCQIFQMNAAELGFI